MKTLKILLSVLIVALSYNYAHAVAGRLATNTEIKMLRKDLQAGRLEVGKTRLKQVRELYGDALTIANSERRITYEYDDIKLEFNKQSYYRDWETDSFQPRVYTDDVDALRYDLESDKVVGSNITYKSIVRDYGEPTFSEIATYDGKLSYFYWGEVKLIFENVYFLRSWRVSSFDREESDVEVLTGK